MEKGWEDIGGSQDQILSIEKFGGYRTPVTK